MTELEIINRLHEIRGYISSEYFKPEQAKALYSEEQKLEKMLEILTNDQQKETQNKREKN
jgi:hypothetical protein